MPKTPQLRELRERAALSQDEFSNRSGVSRATIADLEAGNRSAQARTVRRLADALGIAPEELYGESADPKAAAPSHEGQLARLEADTASILSTIEELDPADRPRDRAALEHVRVAVLEIVRALAEKTGEEVGVTLGMAEPPAKTSHGRPVETPADRPAESRKQ